MSFQSIILAKEDRVFGKKISITDEFVFISFLEMTKDIVLRLLLLKIKLYFIKISQFGKNFQKI